MEDLTLAVVLTAAGATASAALITGLIAILKQLVVIGPWIQADREPTTRTDTGSPGFVKVAKHWSSSTRVI